MADGKRIVWGCDHGGLILKAPLFALLAAKGWTVEDLGPPDSAPVDYPDYAKVVCGAIPDTAAFGLLVCGTGIGMSMAANRYPHIRAALCHDATTARLTREHNNANILVLGARVIGEETAKDCLIAFLDTAYSGGRHQKRLEKFSGTSI